MNILTLDIATKMGVCNIVDNSLLAFTIEDKSGIVGLQSRALYPYIVREQIIGIENWNAFNNPNPATNAKLAKRIGFYEHDMALGHYDGDIDFHLLHAGTVRKKMGINTGQKVKLQIRDRIRELTELLYSDDETDAIAMALYLAGHDNYESILKYEFSRGKKVVT